MVSFYMYCKSVAFWSFEANAEMYVFLYDLWSVLCMSYMIALERTLFDLKETLVPWHLLLMF